jgi:NAD(P)H-dependent FMN reductase
VRVLLCDGSLRPGNGNTAAALDAIAVRLRGRAEVARLDLAGPMPDVEVVVERVLMSDALIVGSGTYWHGWGSPLQRFLEVLTPWEGTEVFAGKPAAVVITADAYGGPDLAARLLHTLSSFGCLVPPCSTVVLTRAGMGPGHHPDDADRWTLDDLDPLVANLLAAAALPRTWATWSVRALARPSGPWPTGPLDLATARFVTRG